MRYAVIVLIAAALFAASAKAQSGKVQWSARDASGNEVTVPADRVTIVAFIRPGQTQSDETIKQITDVVAQHAAARVVIVLSGPDNAAATQKIAPLNKSNWPIVLDPEYAIAGRMGVHVWPETIVVAADGVQLARLAGLPHSFSTDLAAHLDFASSKINQAERDRRLTTRNVVAPTSQQAATRYLIIANALLERDQLDQAAAEIQRGLSVDPNEPSLRLALARVRIHQKQHAAALQIAEQLHGVVPPAQCSEIRAEALIGLERWADARLAADEAVRLNPRPAHAHYLCGLVAAHDQDFKSAAEAFRKAYEAAERQRR